MRLSVYYVPATTCLATVLALAGFPRSVSPVVPAGPPAPAEVLLVKQRTIPPGTPVRLQIPSLSVDAPVVPVRLTHAGAMEVPAFADTAGWFAPGVRPGESGNAVLAGHLDAMDGSPGIFWSLHRLHTGDALTVQDDAGTKLRFHVENIQSYAMDDVPLQRIFGSSTGARLNLVTCYGKWNKLKETYDRRLVVYASLDPHYSRQP
ncbi:MAG: peptidase sortase [Candidatus Peribacteria bacterium]|nr:peptidase sortase [Candidatus Peribacteria bacterium]